MKSSILFTIGLLVSVCKIYGHQIYNNDLKSVDDIEKNQGRYSDLSVKDTTTDQKNHCTKIKIISKKQWSLLPTPDDIPELQTPVAFIVIIHTESENCNDHYSCSLTTKHIQEFHKSNLHWRDIAYNFLIGGDGSVYEGRGWKKIGSFARNFNDKSIGIAFIGNFMKHEPTNEQISAAKRLIQLGVERGYISSNYKLVGHRQIGKTLSPGDQLFENIKTWARWDSKIYGI